MNNIDTETLKKLLIVVAPLIIILTVVINLSSSRGSFVHDEGILEEYKSIGEYHFSNDLTSEEFCTNKPYLTENLYEMTCDEFYNELNILKDDTWLKKGYTITVVHSSTNSKYVGVELNAIDYEGDKATFTFKHKR